MPSVAQVAGQVTAVPLQRYGAQLGLPACPAGTGVHAPVEQVPHAPHAELQHVPPKQNPDWHWLALEQPEPFASFETH